MSATPTFQDCYYAPLLARIASLNDDSSLREMLDILHPQALQAAVKQGSQEAKSTFSDTLSSRTLTTMGSSLASTQNLANQMMPIWEEIDNHERYGTLKGIAAGALSEEAGLGAAIGTAILPGIGSVIGGAIGGWMAGNKLEEKAQAVIQQYFNMFNQFCQTVDSDFDRYIQPLVEQDFISARTRAGATNEQVFPLLPMYVLISVMAVWVIFLVVLGGLHWGVKAIFLEDSREVEIERTVTKRETKTEAETYIKVTSRRATVRAYPSKSAKKLELLARGDERQGMPEDNRAPKGWIPVKATDGTAGWLQTRAVELGSRQKIVPYEKTYQVTDKKTVTAFHFGKPTFGVQFKTFYPLWMYIVAGLGLFLIMVDLMGDKRGSLFTLTAAILLVTSGHLVIQTINFAVMHFWGTPLPG